jgi:predicted  nucleic acid-binding Zn-ribbon protein
MPDPNGQKSEGFYNGRYSNILQTLVVVGMGLGGLWAGVINPIREELQKSELTVRDLTTTVNGAQKDLTGVYLAIREYQTDKEQNRVREQDLRDTILRLADKDRIDIIDRIDTVIKVTNTHQDEIKFLRENQVTRSELVVHWEGEKELLTGIKDQLEKQIAAARDQIDTLRRDFGGQYTIGTEVQQLRKELDTVRQQLLIEIAPSPKPRPQS